MHYVFWRAVDLDCLLDGALVFSPDSIPALESEAEDVQEDMATDESEEDAWQDGQEASAARWQQLSCSADHATV